MATAIKVDRVVLLDALKMKHAEQVKLRAEYNKAQEKYKKEQEAFANKIIALVKSGKLEIEDTNYRSWSNTLTIEVKADKAVMPVEPQSPKYPDKYLHDGDYEELERTIKLLGMTNEPSVSTSVYKSVAQWL